MSVGGAYYNGIAWRRGGWIIMGLRPRSSLKFEWDIVMQLPGICGVHYKSTTSTVGVHQKSQPVIPSFFAKQSKDFIPPTIPTPAPVITYAIDPASEITGTQMMGIIARPTPLAPNRHAVNVLAALEKAMRNLPALPDASDSDEIAAFSGNVPTDLVKEEAWEYLDPMLNRFLGFNRIAESLFNMLRGGERGLSAMVQYLKEFVGLYDIDGALLEGKVQRLVNVIQSQCITLTRSNNTYS